MGIETPTNSLGNNTVSAQGGAESGAKTTKIDRIDADLALVVERWEVLPEAVRAGIVAMVKAASAG